MSVFSSTKSAKAEIEGIEPRKFTQMKPVLFLGALAFTFFTCPCYAQAQFESSKGHSHNDYMQPAPFEMAFRQGFASVEADVHLRNDTLFVAHDTKDISSPRTLSALYLKPLERVIRENKGVVYANNAPGFQLLVDIKTASAETMAALILQLDQYKSLFVPHGPVKLVVSGNMPAPAAFDQYPLYVFFDGRPGVSYTTKQLERIGLISQDFTQYSKWNGKGIPVQKDREAIIKVISQARQLQKPFRFWANPDNINSWKVLSKLGVDYINTAKVNELGSFLNNRAKSEYKEPNAYEPYLPSYRNNDGNGKVKNVILLIGDGMGLAQIHAGLTGNKGQLNLTRFLNIGFSKTASSDNYITDSAAGATAFATGKKTRNRAIGVDSNLVPVRSIISDVKLTGRSTALISAGDITDATPAVFYAHQPDRSMQAEIARDFLKEPVDILIGGGYKHFYETGILDSLTRRGYGHSADWQTLGTMKSPFLMLDDGQTKSKNNGREDFLTESFQKAIQSFKGNKKGFFLMAEGAQIDYGGHDNNVSYVVTEMLDFDKLVGEALRFADSNGETLVIVTADHETGGLTLLDGNIATGYVDGHFSTNDHTGIMVPIFAYGPQSMSFRGVFENTEIYHKILAAIKR